MKITIDENVCLKHNLTLEETLVALAVKNIRHVEDVFGNLENREVLKRVGNDYKITQHWNDVMDEIIADSQKEVDDEERLEELAQKVRECYPAGKMPGTPYYYRCNKREVILKLKKFLTLYGDYPDDRIVEATKRYVASFNGNYRYLPLVKYFIIKNKVVQDEDGTGHFAEYSPLADYLENKNDDNLVTASDEWLLTVRN